MITITKAAAPATGLPTPNVNATQLQQPAAQMPADASALTALNNIAQSIKGVNDVDRGTMPELFAQPAQIICNVASAAGGGAAAITQPLFNNDYLMALITNNGSGASTVTTTFNDGFSGGLIARIIEAYGNKGLPIKQLQLTYQVTATGVQDKAALNNSQPTLIMYNGDGSTLPQVIPIQSTGTPAYNQTGFLIINVKFKLKRYSQLSIVVPPGDTASLILVPDYSGQ